MTLTHGQSITAEQIEQETRFWNGDRFEHLCNAYVWSIAPQAQFSSIAHAKDGGIDAEVTLGEEWDSSTMPLLKRGRNVFQYKKREEKKQWSDIKNKVQGEWKRLAQDGSLSKYILMTNIRLTSVQIKQIKESIAADVTQACEKIEIVDAGKLAAFLNNHPHIRSAFFSSGEFSTWDHQYEKEKRKYPIHVDWVGRDKEIDELKPLIKDQDKKCIIISGPHGIGKTRLALEATKDEKNRVVFALSPEKLSYKDFDELTGPKTETLCIVDDPPKNKLKGIVESARQMDNIKLIVTFPTKDTSLLTGHGLDPRDAILELQPFDPQTCREFVYKANTPIPHPIEDWIVRRSGGNPGILLLAVAKRSKLLDEPTEFTKAIAEGFEEDINERFGKDAVEVLKRFSILSHVGYKNKYKNEIETICEVFPGVDANTAFNQCEKLIKAGWLQEKGDFLEVPIPLLANHLAAKLLRVNQTCLYTLITKLNDTVYGRLFARLSELESDEMNNFWEEFLNTFFEDKSRIFQYTGVLKSIAGTQPEQVMKLLKNQLKGYSLKEREELSGQERSDLADVFRQLLYRKNTGEDALYWIGWLAEGEEVLWSNNIARTFMESFHYSIPRIPLSYHQRVKVLKKLAAIHTEKTAKLIIDAVVKSFQRSVSWSDTASQGAYPFDFAFTPKVWSEVSDYVENVLSLLWEHIDPKRPCADYALDRLPDFLRDLSWAAPDLGDISLEHFKRLVDDVIAKKRDMNINNLLKGLKYTKKDFESTPGDDDNNEYQERVNQFQDLISKIENSPFEVRIKSLLGGWSIVTENRDNHSQEVHALAKSVMERKEELSGDLIQWLSSEKAVRGSEFFYELGVCDEGLTLWDRFFHFLIPEKPACFFLEYFRGLVHANGERMKSIWEKKINSAPVPIEIWIMTLMLIKPNEARIQALIHKIKEGVLPPETVANAWMYGSFLIEISSDKCAQILQAMQDHSPQSSVYVLYIVYFLIEDKKREFCDKWMELSVRCFDSLEIERESLVLYGIDTVAARIVEKNPEKGFELFEKALKRYAQSIEKDARYMNSVWNPFELYTAKKFADVLKKNDPRRFYKIYLNLVQLTDFFIRTFQLMKEYLDLDREYDVVVGLAKEKIEYARTISLWITGGRSRFFDFADEILPLYPNDEYIRIHLHSGLMPYGVIIRENETEFVKSLEQEVDARINDLKIHTVTKNWLMDEKEYIQKQIQKHLVWDYNIDIATFRSSIQDKDSSLHLWAVARVLEKGTISDIQKLLTLEDIEEALPNIKLSEGRQNLIEKLLRVWRNEV